MKKSKKYDRKNEEKLIKDQIQELTYAMVGKNSNIDLQLLNQFLKEQTQVLQKFKKNDVNLWLENPEKFENKLRQVHLYLLRKSLFYKRIINYFSEILTFDYILIPMDKRNKDYNTKAFQRDYLLALDFLDKINLRDKLNNITQTITGEDAGFYYMRETSYDICFQQMPFDYCKIVGKNNLGYQYAIDLNYFDKQGVQISNYPTEIIRAYNKFKSNKNKLSNNNLFLLNNKKAPVFKFDEKSAIVIPPFIALYFDIFDIFDFKDMIKNKMLLENWKILFQKIPMKNDKDAKKNDFLLSIENATKFHNAVKKNLPRGVSVVTSPMDIEGIVTEKNHGQMEILNYPENSFYNSAGVSNLLFNSAKSGSVGLNYSIKTDEMFVIHLYREFERWINYQLKIRTKTHKFKILFPDITKFNRKEKLETYLKTSQFGFPKSLVSCAMGLTPSEMQGLTMFENSIDITNKLKPLQSSHTTADKKDRGRDEKGLDDNPADSTITGKDNESNDNRA